jgi:hypothetical protein
MDYMRKENKGNSTQTASAHPEAQEVTTCHQWAGRQTNHRTHGKTMCMREGHNKRRKKSGSHASAMTAPCQHM